MLSIKEVSLTKDILEEIRRIDLKFGKENCAKKPAFVATPAQASEAGRAVREAHSKNQADRPENE